ncbi:unnamed protein product [marine sediment metagenome]|uniref:Uncharacterized protein n=1 Tax=marine sediment metagenome TaxID=412755 RepID=X0WSQ6_9ZZZZ
MIRAAILSEILHAIFAVIVIYIMVAGDEKNRGFPLYVYQFFEKETIPIFLALSDKIT